MNESSDTTADGVLGQSALAMAVVPQAAAYGAPSRSMSFKMRFRADQWFALLWLIISMVSVHDAFLLIQYQGSILEFEENPVLRMVIAAAQGNVYPAVALKAIGTIAACSALIEIYRRNQSVGLFIAAALAMFQLALLGYLSW